MLNIVTTGIVLLLFTFVAIFSVDRLGRRALMLAGSAGLVVLHAAIALCYMNHSEGIHVLLLILAAIACYASTLAPITWVLLAELFPNRIRGAAMSIAVFSLWVTCAGVAQGFPILNAAVRPSGSFWTFSGICLLGLLFCWRALPETKGKTLEELEAELLDIEFKK
jgi:SP family arabinose:H+ symporter-like MFS transporter